MEGLNVSDANLVVYGHPLKSKSISQAILLVLSALLSLYNETFEGVQLAYNISDLYKHTKILPGAHPYFGVKLNAFPKPNMV